MPGTTARLRPGWANDARKGGDPMKVERRGNQIHLHGYVCAAGRESRVSSENEIIRFEILAG